MIPRNRFVWILVVVTAATLALNAQRVALTTIQVYAHTLSPLAERIGIRCRFVPTCSRYAEALIRRDGVIRGGWKSVRRIARCNPLTLAGTRDQP